MLPKAVTEVVKKVKVPVEKVLGEKSMLDGKKTYMTAGAAILTTAGAVLHGDMAWQQGVIAGLLALSQIFLRQSVASK